MKFYKNGDEIINLAMVKHIEAHDTYVGFYFSDPRDWIRIEVSDKKGARKILEECYEIIKKEG